MENAEPTSGERREPVLGEDGVVVAEGRIEPGMRGEGEQAELAWPTPIRARPMTSANAHYRGFRQDRLAVRGRPCRRAAALARHRGGGREDRHEYSATWNVFHRLVEGHPGAARSSRWPASWKPGSFDMANIRAMETPAIAFFLTLPAPLTALDAWEKMLPTVQRMAELLDGVVLDDSRNALGRQRIAHIRDELRAYDRQHQAPPLTKTPRW
ncbi:cell division protein ZipA C-terminal FtsZ-binding domain-containing protein [Azotobacter sp. CWF10]